MFSLVSGGKSLGVSLLARSLTCKDFTFLVADESSSISSRQTVNYFKSGPRFFVTV
jgi:hypothetical protein